MLTDPVFYLFAIPAVVFAGISKGGFGSGASFLAAPVLALAVEPALALAILMPLVLLVDFATLRPFWGKWSWPDARILILGGVPGAVLGALIFPFISADVLRFLIGTIALSFVVYQLGFASGMTRADTRPLPVWVGLMTGLVSGFTSFVSHAGGPAAAVYLLARGLGKTTYQATTVVAFWAINIAKFAGYAVLGLFTVETLTLNVVLAPAALLGAWLGVRAHHLVRETVFFAITYATLIGAGSKLIWDAVN